MGQVHLMSIVIEISSIDETKRTIVKWNSLGLLCLALADQKKPHHAIIPWSDKCAIKFNLNAVHIYELSLMHGCHDIFPVDPKSHNHHRIMRNIRRSRVMA